MRVGIDGRSLVGQGARGIARYTRTLLSSLAELFGEDEWRILVPGGGPRLAIAGAEVVRVPVPGRLLYGAAGTLGYPHLDKLLGGVDVFWAPTPAPLALSPDVPLVLSLHDLTWETRPEDFTAYERLWHRVARPRRLAARAARVIAVSEVTRAEAISRWQLDPARLVTVAEGVPEPPVAEDSPGQRVPYFLSVGALEPRKAPDVLVRAHQAARERGLQADLILVGDGRMRSELGGAGVHVLGHVPDGELSRLYRGAIALLMASRAEGFGLPPLEAAHHGTPSIVSDLPVFRETLGEAAVRVPVGDATALAQAMLELAQDGDMRRSLGTEACRQAGRFDPAEAARRLREVLAEAARA